MQNTDEAHSDDINDQTTSDDTDTNSQIGAPQLSAVELRVLGVLMEKQLTTPDQYPLTLNSVITACNQKSSREPVSNYNQGEVHRALQALDNKKFVRKERSSRSEKYSQQFMHQMELGRNHQALLCVMMLRGPQTVSELNTRTQRMHRFTDKDELEHSIDRLCNRDVPYAIKLGQQPGQRGERIMHLFSGTPTVQSPVSGQNTDYQHTQDAPDQTVGVLDTQDQKNRIAMLETEIAKLSENFNALKAETAELKQQLVVLSKKTDHTS